jgi:hypothetical protein
VVDTDTTAAIVTVNALVALVPAESVTLNVSDLFDTAAVGVPESTLETKLNPAGSVPDVSAQV